MGFTNPGGDCKKNTLKNNEREGIVQTLAPHAKYREENAYNPRFNVVIIAPNFNNALEPK